MRTWIVAITLVTLIFRALLVGGRSYAVHFGCAFGFLVVSVLPVVGLPVLGFLNSQCLTVLVLALILLTTPPEEKKQLIRITLTDIVLVLVCLSFSISKMLANEMSLLVAIGVVEQYFLPYVVGRFYLANRASLSGALVPLSIGIVVLALGILFESITSINLFHYFVWKSPPSVRRHGFYRTYGVTTHPDALGMLMLTIYPLAVAASVMSRNGRSPAWWRILPWLVAACVLLTNARGAWISFALALIIYLTCTYKKLRVPVLLTVGISLVAVTIEPNIPKDFLYFLGGDKLSDYGEGEGRFLEINGVLEAYSGTEHRWLLWKVYQQPIIDAGFFGHGIRDTSSLIPEHLRNHFWTLDNNYVVLLLVYGSSGFYLFILLKITSISRMILYSWKNPDLLNRSISGAAAGSIAGGAAILWSVAMLNDMPIPYMWLIGYSVSLPQVLGQPNAIQTSSQNSRIIRTMNRPPFATVRQ